jgi:hypothetical protein
VIRGGWILVPVLLLAGCTGGSSTPAGPTAAPSPAPAPAGGGPSRTSAPPSAVSSPSAEGVPSAGSRDFGYFRAVLGTSPVRLSFDQAEFLTGAAANEAAAAHGEQTPVPNDYYIVNDNPRLRTRTVAGDAVVLGSLGLNSFVGDNEVRLRRRTMTELLGYLRTPPGRATGFQVVYGAQGVVVRIEEQYQP